MLTSRCGHGERIAAAVRTVRSLAAPDQATIAAAATAIPPRTTAPTEVKKWWDSLSPMQQESLLFTHAAEIGALDGVPAVVRDRANRNRLVELQGQLEAEKQRLEARGGQLSPQERDRLGEIDGKLKGILAIAGRLNSGDATQQQAFLLGIDTAVNGRAIIAMGNPDTAANVCTYVPGTGAKLAGASGEMERADRMNTAATRAGSPSTSTIAWIGYDAPQSIFPEAGSESYAEGARKDLDRFQDGLRATHEGQRSHNVVLGHSYGTTVVGHAAHHERLDVDGVVLLGSPGLGWEVGNAKDLNLPPEHVYATTAENDSIKNTNIPDSYNDPVSQAADPLGRDPADPRFGGQVFTSSPGTPGGILGSGTGEAHSQYWDQDKLALPNIGKIIAGQRPD